MDFIIPRFLQEAKNLQTLSTDFYSCVEYHAIAERRRVRMITTMSLFVVVLSGCKIVHLTTGKDLRVAAGSCFFAPRGSYLFTEKIDGDDGYRTLVFCLDDGFFADFFKSYPELLPCFQKCAEPDIFSLSLTPEMLAYINSVLTMFRGDNTDMRGVLIRLKLQELILQILNADNDGEFRQFLGHLHAGGRGDLLNVLETYYQKPLRMEELAALAGRSLSSLKRDIKTQFRTTPKRWITQRRLKEAKRLLLQAEMGVSEVCYCVGFENVSHFCRLYKMSFGLTPGEERSRWT